MTVKEDFEKYAVKKYGELEVKSEGMAGELSGQGYEDRKEDYTAGAKMARKETLEEISILNFKSHLFLKYIDTELDKLK